MKYLIDTHVILWFLAKDKSLSNKAKDIIESRNEIYVSMVSLWEISIKHSINKLDIMLPNMNLFIEDYIKPSFSILGISSEHIKRVNTLPFIHRDPFDRMLVAQAKVEDMTLITHDQYIPQYPIPTVW